MRIVVEVGANNGNDTEHLLQEAGLLYAVEPDPVLMGGLRERFMGATNLTLIEAAIDLEEGTRTFHIMDHERGINSLYPLHPDLLSTPLSKHWQYQKGMTGQVTVQTIRLDTIMARYDIPHIDYLWIDAQGNDVNALRSLGARISDLQSGRCECTYKVPIYSGVDNSYETLVLFLESHGFNHQIDYTHQDESEVDVKFWRSL